VKDLASPFELSGPAITKHLKVLERAGLISRSRNAQRRPCRIEAKPLEDAWSWLERYREIWDANFARLDDLLDELQTTKKARKRLKKK
jgi:DNA-binding MarR family transcriptional regulator